MIICDVFSSPFLTEGKNTKKQALASEEAAAEENPPLNLFEQNFLHSYAQKAYIQCPNVGDLVE